MNDPLAITNPTHANDAELDATLDHRPESTIVGDYELLDEIARGGMGVVYKAQQLSLERTVALKLILTGESASQEELSRFRLEAQAAARLDHPNIVPVYGFGQLEGRPFISMGFVSGPSLSVLVSRQGKLAPFEAALLIRKSAEALHYAHQQGVVHRDIKPGNILIDEDGEPRITDFGLAKRQDAEQSLTATGQVLGTPTYMPPEQAAGLEVGPAGDIYSLGATLYTALVGRPPFDSTSLVELLIKLAEEAPLPPHHHDAEIPEGLSNICVRCLAKKPEDRYASAQELAEDLSRFLSGGKLAKPKRSVSTRMLMSVLVCVLALIVSLIVWLQTDHATVTATSTQSESLESRSNTAELSVEEQSFVASLSSALDALLPGELDAPWKLRYADAAKQYQSAFESFGWHVLRDESLTLQESFLASPEELRESIMHGLECWELVATGGQMPEAVQLRNIQSVLDQNDQRRQLRLLREDNNPEVLMKVIEKIDLHTISESQATFLALMTWVHLPPGSQDVRPLLQRLTEVFPSHFWVNALIANDLMAIANANASQKAKLSGAAIEPLRICQSARPQLPAVAWMLASTLSSLGNEMGAVKERERAYALVYPEVWPFIMSARELREGAKFSEAAIEAKRALDLLPNFKHAHIERLAALKLAGNDADYKLAEETWANVAESEGMAWDGFFAAQEIVDGVTSSIAIYKRIPDLEKSLRLADAWRPVIKYRKNLSAVPFMFISYDLMGRSEDALEASREAVRRAPDNAEILRLHVCNLIERKGDINELIATAERALQLDPHWRLDYVLPALALAYARSGRIADAQQSISRLFGEAANEGNFFVLGPWIIRLTLAFPELAQTIREVANDDLKPVLKGCRGFAHSLIADHTKARKDFWAAYRSARTPGEFYELTQIMLHAGEVQLAELCARQTVVNSPTDFRNMLTASAVLLRRGDEEFAARFADRAYEQASDAAEHGFWLPSDAALAWERTNEILIAANPNPQFRDREWRGEYPGAGGFGPGSDERWLSAWALRVMSSAESDRARALVAAGKVDEARLICREQLRLHPEDANAHWAAGVVLLAEGKAASATTILERAAKLDPLNGLIELDWARALIETGDSRQSLRHLQNAVTMAAQGRIRGFKPVPVEAAALAIQASESQSLTLAQQAACRSRALTWLQEDLARLNKRIGGIDPIDHAAAAQTLKRILESKHANEIRNVVQGFPAEEKAAWSSWREQADNSLATAAAIPRSPDVDLVTFFKPLERDQETAEWVLSKGGTVLIWQQATNYVDQPIQRIEDLPTETFVTTAISLSNCEIGDADLEMIPSLRSLLQLHLDGTNVTDQGIKELTTRFPTLLLLNIENCRVSDEGVKPLVGLNDLYLRKTLVTSKAVAAMQAVNPGTLILSDRNPRQKLTKANDKPKLPSFALQLGGDKSIPIPVTYESGEPITVEAWVSLSSLIHSTNMNFIGGTRWGPDGMEALFSLKVRYIREFKFETVRSKANIIATTDPSSLIVPDQMTHLTAVYDGAEYRAYLNGKKCGSLSDFPPTRGLLKFTISHNKPMGFRGVIDEVRISSISRYNEDFQPVRRHQPDEYTLALYHFDEGEGDTIHDSSGHERHTTLAGEVKWVSEAELSQ